MNKLYSLALATAVSATVLAVPVYSQDIVVTSQRSVAQFVDDVSSNLDRELDSARPSLRTDPNGFAIVRFECGKDGKPENITLYRPSDDREVNRMAQRAVSRLDSLHPLPSALHEGRIVQANIVIARGDGQYDRLAKQLGKFEAARIASAPGERAVLALSASTNSAS